MTEAVLLNEDGLRSVLLTIYDSRPEFPITDEMELIKALGGPLNIIPVNDSNKLPASLLAEKAMEKGKEFNTPEEIVDSIMGESFINVVTKTKIYNELYRLAYPIEGPNTLGRVSKYIRSSGIDPQCFLRELTFPVEDPAELFRSLRACEKKIFSDEVPVLCKIPLEMMSAAKKLVEKAEVSVGDNKEAAVNPPGEKKQVPMNFGVSYLVEEDRPEKCFEYFSTLVNDAGIRGLCITRSNPKIIREKYLLPEADILWLTDRESSKEKTVSPSLESLAFELEAVFSGGGNSVVLLDGVEYLISSHSFQGVLKFLRQMIDTVSENDAALFIPLSPDTISIQEIKTLEREMQILDPSDRLLIDIPAPDTSEGESFDGIDDLEDLSELEESPGADRVRSLTERMNRIKQIAQNLQDASGTATVEEKIPEQDATPTDDDSVLEERVSMGNQIKEWLEDGYKVEHLKFMLEAEISTLRAEFSRTMGSILKLKELHGKVREAVPDHEMAEEMISTMKDPGETEKASSRVEEILRNT